MDRTGIVIQARMNSTRLPGKVMMDFCGKPMLLFQIDVLRQFHLGVDIVVATSDTPQDDAVEALCLEQDIPYLRGSEPHVFQRYHRAAEKFQFDHIIRLTGDNPLPNYNILHTCLEAHRADKPDLTTTRMIHPDRSVARFAPKGSSVDILKGETLLRIDPDGLDPFQREHVIPIYFDGDYVIRVIKDFSHLTAVYSVDEADDFKRVAAQAQAWIDDRVLIKTLGFDRGERETH